MRHFLKVQFWPGLRFLLSDHWLGCNSASCFSFHYSQEESFMFLDSPPEPRAESSHPVSGCHDKFWLGKHMASLMEIPNVVK